MIQKAKSLWYSLPHWVQALVVLFVTSAVGTLEPRFQNPAAACWTWPCIEASLVQAVCVGVIAVRTFYMRPGPGRAGGPAVEIPAAAKPNV